MMTCSGHTTKIRPRNILSRPNNENLTQPARRYNEKLSTVCSVCDPTQLMLLTQRKLQRYIANQAILTVEPSMDTFSLKSDTSSLMCCVLFLSLLYSLTLKSSIWGRSVRGHVMRQWTLAHIQKLCSQCCTVIYTYTCTHTNTGRCRHMQRRTLWMSSTALC